MEHEDCTGESIQDQWSGLVNKYVITIQVTQGCGARGQSVIDMAHKKLCDFARQYPEYKNKIPKLVECSDDGTFGFSTGLANFYRR